ncbi:phospholipase D family protein [Pseudomonas syringae group genomosp. 3]|nr:phospholipase D family protein [Pseudomonas syringae group genomosp. 3]
MELLLLPRRSGPDLQDIYRRALRESSHLYIVSAYLTSWDGKLKLGDQCESFTFIVGKDFGITRKVACENVLKWLPADRQVNFLAAEAINGFHPKAVFWRELDGTCHALVGSSNLSKAAFSTNYEANGYSEISEKYFTVAEQWITDLAGKCVTLDIHWLSRYREATQPRKPNRPDICDEIDLDNGVFDLVLPDPQPLKRYEALLERRRSQMRKFEQVRPSLEALFRKSAKVKVWDDSQNLKFYSEINTFWSFPTGARFQGLGWERQGRGSNFQEFARSLVHIIDASELPRDGVVGREIDRLHDLGVSTRGALLSEMLCQFFPTQYHVLDRPVREWLRDTGVAKIKGASEGANYLRSARLLRTALSLAKRYPAKNIAELDAVIWLAKNPEAQF